MCNVSLTDFRDPGIDGHADLDPLLGVADWLVGDELRRQKGETVVVEAALDAHLVTRAERYVNVSSRHVLLVMSIMSSCLVKHKSSSRFTRIIFFGIIVMCHVILSRGMLSCHVHPPYDRVKCLEKHLVIT